MKRVLFLLILMSSCYSVERSCVDFKTGVFEFSTSINDSIITSNFTRTDNYEIETFNGVKDSSIIKWVNECEFLLTKIRPKTNQEKRPIRIKIRRHKRRRSNSSNMRRRNKRIRRKRSRRRRRRRIIIRKR